MYRIIHNCPAYKIDDILKLTINQYAILLEESGLYEYRNLALVLDGIRVATNGSGEDYQKFKNALLANDSSVKQRNRRRKENTVSSFDIDKII